MWYPHTVTVAAASEPVTATEAKTQCRIDGSDSDSDIAGLIAAARGYVESYLGSPLISRTVTVKCNRFADFAAFPVVPLSSVSGITYVDGAGSTQTLSTSVYEVRSDGLTASIALKNDQSWPDIQTGSRITVTAVVGYSSVPDEIKHAILLLISQWYDNRAAASDRPLIEVPHAVEALLANRRVFGF